MVVSSCGLQRSLFEAAQASWGEVGPAAAADLLGGPLASAAAGALVTRLVVPRASSAQKTLASLGQALGARFGGTT